MMAEVPFNLLLGLAFLGFLFLVIVVLFVVLWFALQNRDSRTPAVHTHQPPQFSYGQQVTKLPHGKIEAYVSHLAIQRSPSQYEFYYEFRLPWPTGEFRLEVFPTSGRTPQRVFPGLETVIGEIDDEGLHFEVLANEARTAQQFLNEAVQNQINLLYQFGTPDLHLTIAGGCLLVRKRDLSGAMHNLQAVSQWVFRLYDTAIAAVEPGLELIADGEDWAFETALCGICGEEVNQDAVQCLSCKTPHHRECWDYFGACSIYACGETQYVITGQPAGELLQPKSIPRHRDFYNHE